MMEPQLKARVVRITRTLPRAPVIVMADRVRLEQVIINLLRNAIDATRGLPNPEIEILLSAGDTATLAVRDNGHGIEDLENLFEPFYTTKKPGEGVGCIRGAASHIGPRGPARPESRSGGPRHDNRSSRVR
jgi:two-component system C4-dicarboxylate transport sensor histidine kinase DctB